MMHLALIRGINVGGNKRLPMSDLRKLFEHSGFTHVASLLQSGNVVFDAPAQPIAALERMLEAELQRRLEIEADFILRTSKQWQAIIAANPFRNEAAHHPSHLAVMCFKSAAKSQDVIRLRKSIVGREKIECVGQELYIVYPDGIGRSRLTHGLIEKTLDVRGTARNWNTALKIGRSLSV